MKQQKIDMLQNMGTISALVISIIAMFTSIYEANILKAQQKALVWPYLGKNSAYNSDGYSLFLYNNGTGPAIIKTVEVTAEGEPVKNFMEMIDSLMPNHQLGYGILRANKLHQYVFKPGEEVEVFGFPWNEETRKLANLIHNKVRIRVCYESVLGDSWIYDSKDDSHKEGEFKVKTQYIN